MKINSSGSRPVSGLGDPTGVRPASETGGNSGSGGPPLATDGVHLSNLSASLTAAIGDSATRLKRLAGLAAAALSGGYHVDSMVVSDSIIRESLQFGGAKYL